MNVIYKYRKECNLSQNDLVSILCCSGLQCSKSDISRWERGLQIPSCESREILATILHLNEYELFKDILINLDYKNYRGIKKNDTE